MSKPHAIARLLVLTQSLTVTALLASSAQAEHLELEKSSAETNVSEKKLRELPGQSKALSTSGLASQSEILRPAVPEASLDLDPNFVDRAAFVNVIRERKSLELLNFWQGKTARLYIGVGPTGLAGINLTQNRNYRPSTANNETPDYAKLIETLTANYQNESRAAR